MQPTLGMYRRLATDLHRFVHSKSLRNSSKSSCLHITLRFTLVTRVWPVNYAIVHYLGLYWLTFILQPECKTDIPVMVVFNSRSTAKSIIPTSWGSAKMCLQRKRKVRDSHQSPYVFFVVYWSAAVKPWGSISCQRQSGINFSCNCGTSAYHLAGSCSFNNSRLCIFCNFKVFGRKYSEITSVRSYEQSNVQRTLPDS